MTSLTADELQDRNKYRNGRKILGMNLNAFTSNIVYDMLRREVQSRGYGCLEDKYLILEEPYEVKEHRQSFKDAMKEKIKDASESFGAKSEAYERSGSKEVLEVKQELEKTKHSNLTLKKNIADLKAYTVEFWCSQVKSHPAITPGQIVLVDKCFQDFKDGLGFNPPDFDNMDIDNMFIDQNKKIEKLEDGLPDNV